MEATRVDIVYRPLRIGFALNSSDRASFRRVVRLCNTFWGGRYNPILTVDQPEAAQLIELFRPDFLVPIGDDSAIADFVANYPYLLNPLLPKELFIPASRDRDGRAQLLDIQNLIVHWRETAEWKRLLAEGFRVPSWETNDPLADAFLAHFGGLPDPVEIGVDYDQIFSDVTSAYEIRIAYEASVPPELLDHPGISDLNRLGLKPHYASYGNSIYPGLYVGDANNGCDLVNFWNLRACGILLHFLDPTHAHRTADYEAIYIERLRTFLSGQSKSHRQPAIWSRADNSEQAREASSGGDFLLCQLGESSWNGLNVYPHRMHFGEETSLGVLGGSRGHPRVRFALKEKPYSSDVRFIRQHLVASISLIGARSDGVDYTFTPPCIPELNEFAARSMHHNYAGLRLERNSVGVVISTTDHDIRLDALSVPTLIEQIFRLGGFSANLSSSGLITRQLISHMGGIDGARAFKIPGVRRLLKTYGPNASFTRAGALQLIGSTDPVTGAKFADHRGLYIEPRESGTDLTPKAVFSPP